MFCCTLLYVHSSIAIILMGKRELVALLNLSSWCLVVVEQLFLAVPWGCLRFVIVVFPDHTHLLFLMSKVVNCLTSVPVNYDLITHCHCMFYKKEPQHDIHSNSNPDKCLSEYIFSTDSHHLEHDTGILYYLCESGCFEISHPSRPTGIIL